MAAHKFVVEWWGVFGNVEEEVFTSQIAAEICKQNHDGWITVLEPCDV